MRGSIKRRGKTSWEIRYDVAPRDVRGRRRIRTQTVRGTRKAAERALTAALAALDTGSCQPPVKQTVGEYLVQWIETARDLTPKTCERYQQLIELQIIPHIGDIRLDRLSPKAVAHWHATLLERGRSDGGPLHPRTVGHAHRCLRSALSRAVGLEILTRNVAAAVHPPSVPEREIVILSEAQSSALLPLLAADEHAGVLYPVAALALGAGLRRGEILALAWHHLDPQSGVLTIARSLEETKQRTLRIKRPKSKAGFRRLTLPPEIVDILLGWRRAINQARLAIGLGGVKGEDLMFAAADGTPPSPDNISRDFRRWRRRAGVAVTLHGLRHCHVSTLIHAGIDLVAVSRRVGHSRPSFTMDVYGHLLPLADDDARAADAIAVALGGGKRREGGQ